MASWMQCTCIWLRLSSTCVPVPGLRLLCIPSDGTRGLYRYTPFTRRRGERRGGNLGLSTQCSLHNAAGCLVTADDNERCCSLFAYGVELPRFVTGQCLCGWLWWLHYGALGGLSTVCFSIGMVLYHLNYTGYTDTPTRIPTPTILYHNFAGRRLISSFRLSRPTCFPRAKNSSWKSS
jgi:hypothetical protein